MRYPQRCEPETEASGRLPGTPVQRLATIAHGDGIRAMHVTASSLAHICHTMSVAAQGDALCRHLKVGPYRAWRGTGRAW
jgi:hypothetical protein